MKYEIIINLLDNTPNQPTKFRTKYCIEINDDSHGTFNTNSQIKFKPSVLRSSLCDYNDTYILVKGTIIIAPLPTETVNTNNNDKKVVFKNCASFTDCISEISNTQIDNAKCLDVVMPMNRI